jgi:hypothetical protein
MNDTTKPTTKKLIDWLANPDYIVVGEYRTQKLALPYWYTIEVVKDMAHFYIEVGIDQLMVSYPSLITLLGIMVKHEYYTEVHIKNIYYRCVAYHA